MSSLARGRGPMDAEKAFLIVAGALTGGLVAFSAFLILLGRRAGRFGAAAAVLATLYSVIAVIVLTGTRSPLWPGSSGSGPISFSFWWGMAGAAPTPTAWDIAADLFGWAVLVFLVLMLPLGWLLYAYRRYRHARQEELAHVITAAVETQMPLAPAVRAYLNDRPREGRAAWDAALLLLFPPGYLVWTQRRTFDDRVARLSTVLAAGAPLSEALRIVRGVVPREFAVAAEVGEVSGRLADCLKRADRERLDGVWLEVLPRVLYPLLLLLFLGVVGLYLSDKLVPLKYTQILVESKEPIPSPTSYLFDALADIDIYMEALGAAVLSITAVFVILAASPTIRWHLPVLGRPFRWEVQGLVLRMLGALFEAGRPAPEALSLLGCAQALPTVVRRRLARAHREVTRGEPLPEALHAAGLMPGSMAPLVSAAVRTRTLPFALSELGELLTVWAARLIRRASLVIAPMLIVVIGMVVGWMAVGIFLPLINIMARLSE